MDQDSDAPVIRYERDGTVTLILGTAERSIAPGEPDSRLDAEAAAFFAGSDAAA